MPQIFKTVLHGASATPCFPSSTVHSIELKIADGDHRRVFSRASRTKPWRARGTHPDQKVSPLIIRAALSSFTTDSLPSRALIPAPGSHDRVAIADQKAFPVKFRQHQSQNDQIVRARFSQVKTLCAVAARRRHTLHFHATPPMLSDRAPHPQRPHSHR